MYTSIKKTGCNLPLVHRYDLYPEDQTVDLPFGTNHDDYTRFEPACKPQVLYILQKILLTKRTAACG